MSGFLERIVCATKERIRERKRFLPPEKLFSRIDGKKGQGRFRKAIAGRDAVGIIAEFKKASPSAGLIAADRDPERIGRIYEKAGAAAVSVLTEQDHFKGKLEDLSSMRKAVAIPILRKDFIVDPYQVAEAVDRGADAVLLIAAVLSTDMLAELLDTVERYGMDALVEVHTREELETVLSTKAAVIGINNRNLRDLHVDLAVTENLSPLIGPGRLIVAESGFRSAADIRRAKDAGVHAVLIGERFMRSPDMFAAVQEMVEAGKK